MTTYRIRPEDTERMPSGVPYIVANELAERFSYYGMCAVLMVFMTEHLRDAAGALAPMTPEQAKTAFHTFRMAAYFMPLLRVHPLHAQLHRTTLHPRRRVVSTSRRRFGRVGLRGRLVGRRRG